MASVLSFLVAICFAIQFSAARQSHYMDQLRMARAHVYVGNATEICHLLKDEGLCKGFYPKYFYDTSDGQCKEFIYGGCYGNLNNFDTYNECKKVCGGTSRKYGPKSSARGLASDAESENPVICELPKEQGMCDDFVIRFYYDLQDRNCESFVYSGCQGNENNFETFEMCDATCGRKSTIDICHLSPDKGPCKGYFQMFYFDPETKSCKKFIYGGCQGNGNNFETKDECIIACEGNPDELSE
ncbi:carboxypeptidase inhibitor SmCI-like [Ornithodoros turicata]|uniref:carboxypeptidase inhibitor SmCI-like n=1 Tax=Ornithodoros turicata TaxID=34597 RepID=UPI003139F1BD